MQIRRDYSQPLFGQRRKRHSGSWLTVLVFIIALVGALFFIDMNFQQLQLKALSMIGEGPAPTPFASTYAQQGYDLFLAGDVELAAESFAQAVRQQPNNIEYIYEYGRMLLESGDYETAITIGQQGIDVAPTDPRGYAIKARALDLNGQSEEAIPVGQQGLQVDPDFAPLQAALSSAYGSIDRYDMALEFGARAVELDPLDANAHRVFAFALITVGERDAAIEQLEQAISIYPNLTAPYFELAAQYRGASDFEMVVATYESVLTIDPGNPKGNLRLCQVYIQVGQDNRAQGYCEDALAAQSDYAEAMSTLGWVMYRRRNYEGAIEMFRTCEESLAAQGVNEVNEDTIRCWYMRGLAHYYLGECDESWRLLNLGLGMTVQLPSYAATTIDSQIRDGLSGVVAKCNAYIGLPMPTEIPPTAIPPTPIGG